MSSSSRPREDTRNRSSSSFGGALILGCACVLGALSVLLGAVALAQNAHYHHKPPPFTPFTLNPSWNQTVVDCCEECSNPIPCGPWTFTAPTDGVYALTGSIVFSGVCTRVSVGTDSAIGNVFSIFEIDRNIESSLQDIVVPLAAAVALPGGDAYVVTVSVTTLGDCRGQGLLSWQPALHV